MNRKPFSFSVKPLFWVPFILLFSLFSVACSRQQPANTDKSVSKGGIPNMLKPFANEVPLFSGTLTIKNQNIFEVGEITRGESGYSNLIGAQVVVKNPSGEIVGVSKLGDLKLVEQQPIDPDKLASEQNTDADIVQTFSIKSLPKEKFYELIIGSRPPVTYSYAELESSTWKLDLTIGD